MSTPKEKVAKLLAMANDKNGNEHEVENALRMAEVLIRKHSIDIATLEADTGVAAQYDWKSVVMPMGEKARHVTRTPLWLSMCTYAIGKFTDCRSSLERNSEYGMCIKYSGDETDTAYATWLYKKIRDIGYAEARKHPGNERNSFRHGYAARMITRMRVLRAERDEALREVVTSTGTALVVVQNKIALRNAKFGKQRTASAAPKVRSSNGYANGRNAANKVNLHRPIGGGSQKVLR